MIPEEVLQAEATTSVISHVSTGWDLLPGLVAYTWDGNELHPELITMIDNSMDPVLIPQVMIQTVMRFRSEQPDIQLAAVSFTFEGYGASAPPHDAPAEVREQYDKDRLNRTFHERADRREMAMTVVCDGETLVAATSKIVRGENDEQPEEAISRPGDDSNIGGRIIDGVRMSAAVAVISRDRLTELIQIAASGHGVN